MKSIDIIDSYRDQKVDDIVYSHASDIDTVAHVLGIDRNYLSSQVRLHIPWYTETDITEQNGLETIREILAHLRGDLSDFNVNYQVHRRLNGIDSIVGKARITTADGKMWLDDLSQAKPKINFCSIPKSFGIEIQKRMHYIHHAREDTKYHFGLQLENYSAPLCYAAFSDLDRKYLQLALSDFLPSACSQPEKVIVMTRAFGYNPLPSNMMSLMFSCSSCKLRELGYDYIVTALNPFLGFRGSIFFGASYFPYATSPMKYVYDQHGSYLNRRNAAGGTIAQRYKTPPIIWLVHPLKSRDMKLLELGRQKQICQITEDSYASG